MSHPIRKQLGGVACDRDNLYLVRAQDGALIGAIAEYNTEVVGVTESLAGVAEPLCRLGWLVQQCEQAGYRVEPCNDRESPVQTEKTRTPEQELRHWKGMAQNLRWENQRLEAEVANLRKLMIIRGGPGEAGHRSWASAMDGKR